MKKKLTASTLKYPIIYNLKNITIPGTGTGAKSRAAAESTVAPDTVNE